MNLIIPVCDVAFDEFCAVLRLVRALLLVFLSHQIPFELLLELLSADLVEIAEDHRDAVDVSVNRTTIVFPKNLRTMQCPDICFSDAIRASCNNSCLTSQATAVDVDGAVNGD